MAEEALARAGAEDIHPLALVKDLSLSRRQMVEIAKALARKPRILILDEATSALTAADVTKIYSVLKRLRGDGLALVYISHRMHEIAELADECTVFRNGRSVATYPAGTKSDSEVVELMIGREYDAVFPALAPRPTPAAKRRASSCASSAGPTGSHDVSLRLHAGEVIGLGGLDGQGQRELLLALFGVLRGTTGEVLIDGRPVDDLRPGRGQAQRHRHGADPRGSQDRGPDAGDVGARQPLLRRARPCCRLRASSTPRPKREAVARMVRLLAIRSDGTDRSRQLALGRQPAEARASASG